MKKLLVIMVALMPLLMFTACGGDDNSDNDVANSFIVGTWSTTNNYGGSNGSITFKSNGTVSYSEGGDSDNGTYTVNGTTLTIKWRNSGETINYELVFPNGDKNTMQVYMEGEEGYATWTKM